MCKMGVTLLRFAWLATAAWGAWGASAAHADEGMWTFQNFPAALVEQRYGVRITPAWLQKVRLATVRLSDCTASFVSPDGLLLTNQHCVEDCLAEHSSESQSLVDGGYVAGDRSPELRCAGQVADVLVATEDVTAKVIAATHGLGDRAANDMRRRTLARLEQACEQASRTGSGAEPLQCESVDLYEGGQYLLYEYRHYDDVRLVFAPEADVAAFGGDPDNFEFPRWCLDMSVLRVYQHGRPAHTPQYLKIDFVGPRDGQPVFVSGNPGSTERMLTVSQLVTQRDVELLPYLLRGAELRGRYIQFGLQSAADGRLVEEPLSFLENDLKESREELQALFDDAQLARKSREEAELEKRVAADPELARATGDPWAEITQAERVARDIALPYTFIGEGAGFNSQLFRYARLLVRAATERVKPSASRLPGYTDAALPALERQVTADVPVHRELETITLSLGLTRMRDRLGPDDPLVRQVLGEDSPEALAARLVAESKLADPAMRKALWDGGEAAIAASEDPMIELARLVDPEARALRQRYQDEVQAPVRAALQRIAQARFAVLGTSVYPDADFTLRLTFGTVRGWSERGKEVEPFTRLARMFERATGSEPFRVPPSWVAAKDRLDLSTPFNFCTDNDIVGGNSGSPVIDAQGDIVGLIFDGNIESIAGTYWFDEQDNRAVALDTAVVLEALRKVYHADALLAELGAPAG
ncbi:MAG: S46 family peptidase [Steroidobacteraceae bacterium]